MIRAGDRRSSYSTEVVIKYIAEFLVRADYWTGRWGRDSAGVEQVGNGRYHVYMILLYLTSRGEWQSQVTRSKVFGDVHEI